jgi:hypothetical protein
MRGNMLSRVFFTGQISVDILQYLNRVSGEREKIVDMVKNTGKTVILPLIEKTQS